MSTLLDYKQPSSLLLLGYPGSGKSTLAAQMPKPYIVDCDMNLNGVVRFLKEKGVDLSTVKAGTPLDADRKAQFKKLQEIMQEAAADPEVETIVVDSLTTITSIFEVEVAVQQGRKLKGDADHSVPGGVRVSDEQFQKQDWGALGKVYLQFIHWAKTSGKNIIFTAHVGDAEVNGLQEKKIAVPGRTANVIAGWFTEVWLLDTEVRQGKEERKIHTMPRNHAEKPLGLKSQSGLASTEPVDADKLVAIFNQNQ